MEELYEVMIGGVERNLLKSSFVFCIVLMIDLIIFIDIHISKCAFIEFKIS